LMPKSSEVSEVGEASACLNFQAIGVSLRMDRADTDRRGGRIEWPNDHAVPGDFTIGLDPEGHAFTRHDPRDQTRLAVELRARGIAARFRSQRITTGKFPNFTPAVQVG